MAIGRASCWAELKPIRNAIKLCSSVLVLNTPHTMNAAILREDAGG